MKTLINKVLLVTMLSISLFACKKEGQLVTVGTGTPAVLNTSVTSVVLTKPNLNNVAIAVTYTPADFGFDAAITNTVQIAKAGTSFAAPKEFILAAGTLTKSFTHLDLNSMLLSMNLAPDVAAGLEIRIKSTISTSIAAVYSNVKNLTATPFALVDKLFMPGAYQGWDPGTADSLVSATGNGIYTGTIQFTGASQEFKLLKKKAWGAPEYGAGSAALTILVGGSNLVGPTFTGYPNESFLVTADLNANTIVYDLNSWGVIGSASANGWNDDTNMRFNNTTGKWYLTTNLVVGEIKFRKNHNWGVNLGGSAGTLTAGGSNIAVTVAGSYTISLDADKNTYTLVKN